MTPIDRLRFWTVGHIKRSPALWPLFWEVGRRATFLLPHDKSYYGFRHFAKVGGGLFLDIGANNGITALGIHKILPEYAIFSIEADRTHVPALEKAKRRIAGFEYRIIGASDEVTESTLYVPEIDGSIIHALASTDLEYLKVSLGRDFGDQRAARAIYHRQSINTMPLDDLGISPDLIKIDIEGHELAALHGLQRTLSTARPIVFLEFTPTYFPKYSEFLIEQKYQFLAYDPDADTFGAFDAGEQQLLWSTSPLQVNVFCVPVDRLFRCPAVHRDCGAVGAGLGGSSGGAGGSGISRRFRVRFGWSIRIGECEKWPLHQTTLRAGRTNSTICCAATRSPSSPMCRMLGTAS